MLIPMVLVHSIESTIKKALAVTGQSWLETGGSDAKNARHRREGWLLEGVT